MFLKQTFACLWISIALIFLLLGSECFVFVLQSLWSYHWQPPFTWSLSMLQPSFCHHTIHFIWPKSRHTTIQCLMVYVWNRRDIGIAEFITWWNREFNYGIVKITITHFSSKISQAIKTNGQKRNGAFFPLASKGVIKFGHFHSFIFFLVNCGSLNHFTSSFVIWIE